MPAPDATAMPVLRHRSVRRRVFLLAVAMPLLTGLAPALGQVDYTGVPPAPASPDVYVVDTYVGTAAGTGPNVVTVTGSGTRPSVLPSQLGLGGTISLTDAAVGQAPIVDEGDHRLVTGWDVLTIAGLGLTAVVAFAVAAGRFRSP
jgi:hypothetical protein